MVGMKSFVVYSLSAAILLFAVYWRFHRQQEKGMEAPAKGKHGVIQELVDCIESDDPTSAPRRLRLPLAEANLMLGESRRCRALLRNLPPKDARASILRAESWLMEGMRREAISVIEHSLKKNPEHLDLRKLEIDFCKTSPQKFNEL